MLCRKYISEWNENKVHLEAAQKEARSIRARIKKTETALAKKNAAVETAQLKLGKAQTALQKEEVKAGAKGRKAAAKQQEMVRKTASKKRSASKGDQPAAAGRSAKASKLDTAVGAPSPSASTRVQPIRSSRSTQSRIDAIMPAPQLASSEDLLSFIRSLARAPERDHLNEAPELQSTLELVHRQSRLQMYPDYPDLPGAAEEEGDTNDDDYEEGAQTPAPAQEAATAGQSCDAAKAPRGTKALRNQKDAVQRWKEAHAAAVSSRDAVQEDLADLLLDSMQAESLYRSWKTKFKAQAQEGADVDYRFSSEDEEDEENDENDSDENADEDGDGDCESDE